MILNFFITLKVKAFKKLITKKILLTTEEAANAFGVRESAVRGFARLKKNPLPVIKIGKSMLYKRTDIVKFKARSGNFDRLIKKIEKPLLSSNAKLLRVCRKAVTIIRNRNKALHP